MKTQLPVDEVDAIMAAEAAAMFGSTEEIREQGKRAYLRLFAEAEAKLGDELDVLADMSARYGLMRKAMNAWYWAEKNRYQSKLGDEWMVAL